MPRWTDNHCHLRGDAEQARATVEEARAAEGEGLDDFGRRSAIRREFGNCVQATDPHEAMAAELGVVGHDHRTLPA